MREIVILLLVVALLVLVIGAVNQDQRVDLDYVFGTWEGVSVLSLTAISAAAAIVLGLIIAAMARMRVVADRRKLERELQLVYPRLREAERAAGLPAWNPPVTPVVMSAGESSPPVAGTEMTTAEVTAAEAPIAEATDAEANRGQGAGEEPAADPAPPVATADPEGRAAGAAEPGSPPNGEA